MTRHEKPSENVTVLPLKRTGGPSRVRVFRFRCENDDEPTGREILTGQIIQRPFEYMERFAVFRNDDNVVEIVKSGQLLGLQEPVDFRMCGEGYEGTDGRDREPKRFIKPVDIEGDNEVGDDCRMPEG